MKADVPDEDIDRQRVREALDLLGEHFDSVIILANRHEDDGTINTDMGTGNVFARIGQVHEYLIKQKARTQEDIRREIEDED